MFSLDSCTVLFDKQTDWMTDETTDRPTEWPTNRLTDRPSECMTDRQSSETIGQTSGWFFFVGKLFIAFFFYQSLLDSWWSLWKNYLIQCSSFYPQRILLYNAFATTRMCEAGFHVLDVYPISDSYPPGTGTHGAHGPVGNDIVHYSNLAFNPVEELFEKFFGGIWITLICFFGL